MNLHFSYKAAKSPVVEREIQQHVQKLEKRLQVFRPDLIHLHGTLDTAPQNGYGISLNLRLPSGQLSAHDEAASAEAAVKAGFADLILQLNRHKDILRNGHKWTREKGTSGEAEELRTRAIEEKPKPPARNSRNNKGTENTVESASPKAGGNGHATAEEITAAMFEMGDSRTVQAEVRKYLAANLSRLERFVARELRYREANGELPQGLVSREEVIDEVVLAALSVEQRPSNISLEKWFYRLAIQAMRMLASGNSIDLLNLPLEQSVGTPNVTGSDEAHLQFHQPGESLNREDVIADNRLANPEEIAANDELIEQLERSLRGTKSEEREAFVLFAIEGFTVPEIAQITLHPPEQVTENISAARNHLMKKLPASNSLKKKLLQHSTVA
jgi:DNA-directed RNA polymerase specialized sigma24 family protein/ribosome-associated translation inhibitor RaiA